MSKYKIKVIDSSNTYVFTDLGGSVLDSLIAFGYPAPYECRNGNCGECKVKLVSGSATGTRSMDSGLTSDEKQRNYILTCSANPASDIEIKYNVEIQSVSKKIVDVEQAQRISESRVATIRSINRRGNDVLILCVETDEQMYFEPGQYVDMSFDGLPKRSYSIASCDETNRKFEFHIRIFDKGVVSCHLNNLNDIGQKVALSGPYGIATLNNAPNHHSLVLICAGVGFSPIKCIAVEALKHEPEREVILILFVRNNSDFYDNDAIQMLENNYSNLQCHRIQNEKKTEQLGII
ncbi:hypothetical protein CS022_20150 [Veronia nyctiphanis]|uniref:Oxidoreductase n=1 Tax=Veronia nyctiphanis TaxID=1278244 RepID=A0A4Q0YRD4_9GAMM|nr:FAD-binding oxidoreductase [Veronia nyctiphanis]RXJ71659.1 hypothetical protein CS022_20150 [Veronia nyctiphanis]